MRNRQQYMRHRAGAPLWSPFGGMVVAPPRWCSAVEPMRWTGTCDTALVLRCGDHALECDQHFAPNLTQLTRVGGSLESGVSTSRPT